MDQQTLSVQKKQTIGNSAFKIVHDRENCIGCGACAAILEKNWVMADDGKSDPVNTNLKKEEYDENRLAADSCPVNVIHLEDQETGERLI